MAEPTRVPAFVGRLQAGAATDDERLKRLKQAHPDYSANKPSWVVQLDAFEGRGGFLDGSYLWPFPRESEDDFRRRTSTARYHNYIETLVDLYVRFMFTQGVKRDSGNAEYNEWVNDVDGAGTTMDTFLKRLASVGLVNGHVGGLLDKPYAPDIPTGPTKADDQTRVNLCMFTAPSIADWRHEGVKLTSVKLLESPPQPSLVDELPVGDDAVQYLLWDEEGWARFDSKGVMIAADTPGLGLVPLVVLRPKPSQLSVMLGRALVSNANVVRALFNRASEEDQVIRDQAFSVLTVNVDKDANVDEVKTHLGSVVGTAKALVVKGEIDYKTPDQNVPGTIRDNISYLVKEIYRAAHVRYDRDSLAAESAESIRLQYTELNEMLQGFAKSLAAVEQDIARAWFMWMSPNPEAGQKAYEAAKVEAEYPTEFFLDALITDLQAWGEAIGMGLGQLMTAKIKKRAVRRIEPDMDPKELAKIDAEIDAMPTEEEKALENMENQLKVQSQFDVGQNKPPKKGGGGDFGG